MHPINSLWAHGPYIFVHVCILYLASRRANYPDDNVKSLLSPFVFAPQLDSLSPSRVELAVVVGMGHPMSDSVSTFFSFSSDPYQWQWQRAEGRG